jgi:hypothetical protein
MLLNGDIAQHDGPSQIGQYLELKRHQIRPFIPDHEYGS